MVNRKVLKTSGINLRYSMYDFIDAVKKHHIIWNREHENFHNRELRDQAWQEIGLQLCKNFDVASSSEKQEIAKTLLKRWKNTRDSFLRVNRLRQSGEEISRASYIYEKELSFLLEIKAEEEEAPLKKDTRNTVKRDLNRALRSPAKRRRESADTAPDTEGSDLSPTEDGINTMLETFKCATTTLPGLTATQPTVNTFSHSQDVSNMSFSNGNPMNISSNPDPDPDQAFFDSIKPDMQRMSSDQKLEFKIEVLKILRQFKQNTN